MPDVRDVIVIGGGPAGLAAAAAVAQEGLSCVCVDAQGPGGQLINLGRLHDCPELPEGTTGPDALGLLVDRAAGASVELGFGEVRRISAIDGGLWLVESDDDAWLAPAVVVATGLGKGTTGLAGEARYEGRGLSHCANCDGPLYKDQPVVVHGGSRWALTEAIELAGMASQVTLVVGPVAAAALGSTQPERVAWAEAQPNIEIVRGHIAGLVGEEALAAVDVEAGADAETITARALFLFANRRPAAGFLGGLVRMGAAGAIEVQDEAGSTGTAGIFACGDVVAESAESVPAAIAAGERTGQNVARWVKARQAGCDCAAPVAPGKDGT